MPYSSAFEQHIGGSSAELPAVSFSREVVEAAGFQSPREIKPNQRIALDWRQKTRREAPIRAHQPECKSLVHARLAEQGPCQTMSAAAAAYPKRIR
ncbi:hypothetical protein MAE02_53780 [Microvirga aerophila]|uniref:Uncharacterized protein n=1 Tax=Microvirga aerophila TaxID=670291 RepID=A0A512C0E8_9HYPH|nr:hypothetical protein MAE02_53780 [Microvirga aerophila]